jgi:arylsulfatase A-like enzyme/Tfp pilus assembly protein PilF
MKYHDNTGIFLLIILILFFSILFVGCKGEGKIPDLTGEIDYNLLIITIDTLRADRLGCYGFENAETPNIDRLVNNGVMFKNCYSSVPLTLPSHCTIFTGREPVAHNVRNNGTYFLNNRENTLAEIFKRRHYCTHAVISSFVLMSKFGLNQGFDLYDDSLDFDKAANYIRTQIRADIVYAKFKNWLNKNNQKKFFSWIHFYDPHMPYDPPGDYKEKFKNDLYSGEIAYVDQYIGKIIKDLESKRIRDKTLIILTSDHGEAFGEHKEIGHGIFCYEESLKVPLIFNNPVTWKHKKVISHYVTLLDLMPTILQLFDIEIPPGVQGKSFAYMFGRKEDKEEKLKPYYFESMAGKDDMNWAPLTGIIMNQYKYISLPEPELYNLSNDPLEKQNLFKKKYRLAKKLDKELQQYILAYSESNISSKRKLTEMDRKKLESLGYLSSSSPKAGNIVDPKYGIDFINQLMLVKIEISRGNMIEAEKKLHQIISEYPELKTPNVYEYLNDIYLEKGDLKSAEDILKKGIAHFPGTLFLQLKLATLYDDLNRIDEAEKLCHQLLEQDPRYSRAYLILAKIYKKRGQIDRAANCYENAIKIEPLNVKLKVEYADALLTIGKKEAAQNVLTRLLENEVLIKNPTTLGIKTRIGFLLLKMGEYDRAVSLCLQMISHGHSTPEVLNQLGLAFFKKRDFKKAMESYNKALSLDEKNALTLSNLGTLYLTLFQATRDEAYHAKAIDHYKRAVDVDPKMNSAYNGLGAAYSFVRNRKMAIFYWEKAHKNDPDFINVYFNLGITYIEIGQKKKALNYLNQCKSKFYSRLSLRDQQQLDTLIAEASM